MVAAAPERCFYGRGSNGIIIYCNLFFFFIYIDGCSWEVRSAYTRVVALFRGSTVCHNISQSFKITGFLAFIYFSYHLQVKKVNIWHNADSIPNLLYVVGILQFNFPKKHDCSIPDFKYTCCQAAIYKNIK